MRRPGIEPGAHRICAKQYRMATMDFTTKPPTPVATDAKILRYCPLSWSCSMDLAFLTAATTYGQALSIDIGHRRHLAV